MPCMKFENTPQIFAYACSMFAIDISLASKHNAPQIVRNSHAHACMGYIIILEIAIAQMFALVLTATPNHELAAL